MPSVSMSTQTYGSSNSVFSCPSFTLIIIRYDHPESYIYALTFSSISDIIVNIMSRKVTITPRHNQLTIPMRTTTAQPRLFSVPDRDHLHHRQRHAVHTIASLDSSVKHTPSILHLPMPPEPPSLATFLTLFTPHSYSQ